MKNTINWKVRLRNPIFIAQLVLSVLAPILVYAGLSFSDLTTWSTVGELIVQAYSNPYLLGTVVISLYNATLDPTVKGHADSRQALEYSRPRNDKEEKRK